MLGMLAKCRLICQKNLWCTSISPLDLSAVPSSRALMQVYIFIRANCQDNSQEKQMENSRFTVHSCRRITTISDAHATNRDNTRMLWQAQQLSYTAMPPLFMGSGDRRRTLFGGGLAPKRSGARLAKSQKATSMVWCWA